MQDWFFCYHLRFSFSVQGKTHGLIIVSQNRKKKKITAVGSINNMI